MVSPRLANQVAEGSAQLLGTGPMSYMISLWQDQTSLMASGVPMPAPRGSPAGPNLDFTVGWKCYVAIIHVYTCNLLTVHVKLVLGLGLPVVLWSASGPRSNSSVRCSVNRSPKYVLKINQDKENVLKSFKRLVTDSDAFRGS